jgi:hypothetical protein
MPRAARLAINGIQCEMYTFFLSHHGDRTNQQHSSSFHVSSILVLPVPCPSAIPGRAIGYQDTAHLLEYSQAEKIGRWIG